MTAVRIEDKPAFNAAGRKIFISGQDNSLFGKFWAEANSSGLSEELKKRSSNPGTNVTGSRIFGISCVEKDPNNRAFDFYIASECEAAGELEAHPVKACKWAIFSGDGSTPDALIRAELFAFTEWLPTSGYCHANAPELEVYPERDDTYVEFWLPIE